MTSRSQGTFRSHMYRVFLIPTDASPSTELWLEAHTVQQSEFGNAWQFLNSAGSVIRQLSMRTVREITVATDRRRSRTDFPIPVYQQRANPEQG